MDNKNHLFDIRALIELLKSKLLAILIISTFTSLFFISLSYLLNNTYTSSLLVKNNNNGGGSSLSSIGGQFGGLASMAGINLGSSGGGDTLEQIEAQIVSRDFVEHLSTFDNFDVNLLIPKSYDGLTKKLSYKKNEYNFEDNTWLSAVGKHSKSEIHRVFNKNIKITLDDDNSFLKIEYRHISPVVAKYTLNLILQEINAINRNKALSESSKRIEYLNNQLQKNSLSNVMKSINSLTEVELNKLVIASVKTDFTLSVIDSANFPEKKSHPRRSLIGVFTFFISFFILMARIFFINILYTKEDY